MVERKPRDRVRAAVAAASGAREDGAVTDGDGSTTQGRSALCLEPVDDQNRPVVERLWQLYRHDMSSFLGSLPDPAGCYTPGRLPSYFDDADRCGYLLTSGSQLAGFAFVIGTKSEPRIMGDFFVVRALRRGGVGRAAARAVLAAHPGDWEVPFQEVNAGAARFWRQLATELVGDGWSEEARPVPGKPQVPPDRWISLATPASPNDG